MNGEDATAIIGEVAAALDDADRTIAHLTAENVRLRSLLDDALTALAVADQAPELRADITAALAGGS